MGTFAGSFSEIDREIVRSVWAGKAASEKTEHARTSKSYHKHREEMFMEQDKHTAAWQARHKMCAAWDRHMQSEYGVHLAPRRP